MRVAGGDDAPCASRRIEGGTCHTGTSSGVLNGASGGAGAAVVLPAAVLLLLLLPPKAIETVEARVLTAGTNP